MTKDFLMKRFSGALYGLAVGDALGMPLIGKSPYQIFLNIIQTQPGWNEKVKKLKTNYLLISNGTFLDLLLKEKAAQYGWQEKYRDTNAVIYQNLTKKY